MRSSVFVTFHVPLAWLQLWRDRTRLAVAVAGVAFAVLLVFMQLGFRDALFRSSVRIHERLQADIVLIDPRSAYIARMNSFPRRRVYQALAVDGVASVSELHAAVALWKNPETAAMRQILVLGFDPFREVLSIPEVAKQRDPILIPDVVLYDRGSRSDFGPVVDWLESGRRVETEVSGRWIRVGGLFTLGGSFGIDATLVTSELNFVRLFPRRGEGLVDVGLVRLSSGYDPNEVRRQLAEILPRDVEVLTRDGYAAREIDYWQHRTPIGFIFTFGAVMGLIVGAAIVYQILYANVASHLPEYATLKAIGHGTTSLLLVVLEQAMLLAVLGYLPGLAISVWLYRLTERATRMPLVLDSAVAIHVFLLAVLMCAVAGAVAVFKLRGADPADVF